jgi:hypothetical protein
MSTSATGISNISTGFFERARILAGPRFNRWLVPPATLAIHLCIGMAYGFSVFWLPLSKLTARSAFSGFAESLISKSCNWSVATVTHTFEIFIAMLGISAAIWCGWVERVGPRRSGFVAPLCCRKYLERAFWGSTLALRSTLRRKRRLSLTLPDWSA